MTGIEDVLATVPEPAGASIGSQVVAYALDGTALEGVLVKDESVDGKRPGVLVVHDWFGVGESVALRATMLARLGYVAFGADIFGRGVRPGPDTAAQVAGGYYGNLPLMRARAVAGLERLRDDPDVDPDRIAVIGYCFGGAVALELARTGAQIAGVVSFHGTLISHEPPDANRIKAKLLVLAGGSDPVVPDDAIEAWKAELRTAPQVDWQVTLYAGAMHSFTNPQANAPVRGSAYDARADRRSWLAMCGFFAEIFA